jgi:two-component sensor histidine kinase
MEQVLSWLPAKPQQWFVRYGVSAVLVGICFEVMRLVEAASGVSSYFLLYPAIFLAALLFDRGSGFLATGLATVLLILNPQQGFGLSVAQPHWLPLTLFAVVGLVIATLTELLRSGWEKAVSAERAKDVLYRELAHRTKNDFAMAASVLNLQARSQTNQAVREALAAAVRRLLTLSKAHERVGSVGVNSVIKMKEYVDALSQSLLDGAANVSVHIKCDQIELPPEKTIPVGLIINELVTNAIKHAFIDQPAGFIEIKLEGVTQLDLVVEDNGAGCSEDCPPGVGSRLVQILVQQLNGTLERRNQAKGCRVAISFPA